MKLFIITAILTIATGVSAIPQSPNLEVCTRACFPEPPICDGA